MKKKKIIIMGIILILFFGLYMYLKNKENSEKPNVNSNYEYQQKVNEFVEKHKSEDPNIEIKTNESGYTNVQIENKQALMKVMSIDQMLLVDDKITEGVNFITKVYTESKDLEHKELEKYFNKNIDSISSILGIKDAEAYSKLLIKLKLIGDKGEINKAIIDNEPAKKVSDNEFKFNITLKSKDEQAQLFNISMQGSNKDDIKLIWN